MTSNKKRVYCLYRVSTLGQVEKDDIPMQKQFCQEFAAKQGWEVVNELSEKGISGFKTSAKDRDAIQEIQRDAVQGRFDVLLVFMFDRLGRRDDETPFVVEWFVNNGIEVWSATEGQQRFDNHVDKLMNYLRYWQASGESVKTSVRTKTRLEQLTEDGCYTGGSVSYGYRLADKGRTNKKGQTVMDLVIEPSEAEIVRLIFRKYAYEGYGAQRLCRYLSEHGIVREDGRNFPNTSINRMIKNIIYKGIIRNGEKESDKIPELQIVDDETFERAQEIMTARVHKHNEDVPFNTRGKSLLVGNIYCGHCGNRLTLTTGGRTRTNKDGTMHREVRLRYQCHYNVRHPGACDGQSGYGVVTIDCLADKIIYNQLANIKAASGEILIANQHQREIELAKAKAKIADTQYQERQRELNDLKAETIKAIRGESKLNSDLLNGLVEEATESLNTAESVLQAARLEMETHIASAESVRREYAQIISWADMYERCTFAEKKMIAAQFVKAIRCYKNQKIEIDFNVSFEDFTRLGAIITQGAGRHSKEVEAILLQPPA